MPKQPPDNPFMADGFLREPPPGRKFPMVYPFVSRVIDPSAAGNGRFIGSQPAGITIHHTADRDIKRTIRVLQERKLAYHMIIDRDGKVTQMAYLDRKVSHAGPSNWNGKSCNSWHAAIALVSWGDVKPIYPEGTIEISKVKEYEAWNKARIPASDVKHRPFNVSGKMGYWDAATPAQEKTLLEVLRWLLTFGLDPQQIAGHDEAATPPGRKVDPGGVLSMTMAQLRKKLCDETGIKV